MKFIFGNAVNGSDWQPSTKKILYVATSIGALVGPWVLLFMGQATGEQMFDFYKYFTIAALALYGAGKWINTKSK